MEMQKHLWCLISRRAEKPLALPQNHLKVGLFSTYCLHSSKTTSLRVLFLGNAPHKMLLSLMFCVHLRKEIFCTTPPRVTEDPSS